MLEFGKESNELLLPEHCCDVWEMPAIIQLQVGNLAPNNAPVKESTFCRFVKKLLSEEKKLTSSNKERYFVPVGIAGVKETFYILPKMSMLFHSKVETTTCGKIYNLIRQAIKERIVNHTKWENGEILIIG